MENPEVVENVDIEDTEIEEVEEVEEMIEKPTLVTAPIPQFHLKSKAGDLIDLFSAVNTLLDEATFSITNDGVSLREMDSSRIAMVSFSRSRYSFVEYEVVKEGKICIDLKSLLKILSRAGRKGEVTLESAGDRLKIKFGGRTFTMPFLEAGDEEVPEPKIDFTTKIKLTTEGFLRAIEDAELVSDSVKITTNEEGIGIIAEGDLMSADLHFSKGDDITLDLYTQTPASASYSLDYLKDIAKAGKRLGESVTIEYSEDMPMKATFDDAGNTTFWLAPRIE